MFELADRLVGIYKTNDATKSVTINPRLFEQAVSGQLPPAPGSKNAAPAAAATRTVLGDQTNTAVTA